MFPAWRFLNSCSLSILLLSLGVDSTIVPIPEGTLYTGFVSTLCASQINATIDCYDYLLPLATSDFFGPLGNDTLQDAICSGTCGTSLRTYRDRVVRFCPNGQQPWLGYPPTWVGDMLWATYNRTCLTDPQTGEYCTGKNCRCPEHIHFPKRRNFRCYEQVRSG